jgi:hypothetical protein
MFCWDLNFLKMLNHKQQQTANSSFNFYLTQNFSTNSLSSFSDNLLTIVGKKFLKIQSIKKSGDTVKDEISKFRFHHQITNVVNKRKIG